MLGVFDNIVVLLGIIGIIGVGYHFSQTSQDMDSFYKANRALPWSLVVGTLMASWYGGAGTIGTVGYATYMGFAGFFIWSIGAHSVRFPLALWIAPRISVKAKGTIPELLRFNYGKLAAILGSVVIVISCLSIAEIASVGYVGTAAWNIDKFVLAAIVVVVSIGITCLGGLMGVAVTDMIFFFLMVVCVSAAFPRMFFAVGGLEGLNTALKGPAPEMLTMFGGIPFAKAAVLIVLCINIYKDPAFYQRFAAANSPKTGKRAMLLCFSIFLSFDIVCMLNGMIIRANDPSLAVQPEVTYIASVLSYLPAGFKGLFIIGIMGAIVSTLDSYYLIGGEIISNDIIYMLRGDRMLKDKHSIYITRLACVVFGAVGLGAAFQFEYVYDAFLFLSSIGMTLLFVPIIAAIMYDGRKTDIAGLASMISGAVCWIVFKYVWPISTETLGAVDPVLIGLPVSFAAFLIGNRFGTDLNASRKALAGAGKKPDFQHTQQVQPSQPSQPDTRTPEDLKVEWFGMDGALISLFIALSCIYGYGMLNGIDFIIGYMAPGMAIFITTSVFLRYCTEVFSFMSGGKKKTDAQNS